jgi:surfeit locus 1 family protein
MRRTLFLLIIGLGGAAILIALGLWQVQRLAWKEAILADIDARTVAQPVDLPTDPDPARDAYLPVRATGNFGDEELHVLVSARDIGAAYRVIAPFTLTDGRRILVDRGLIATEAKAAARPTGEANVIGNLQWPQETDSFTPAPDISGNIWFARDVTSMAATLGTEPVLLVTRDAPDMQGAPLPMPVDTGQIPNDHLQYAITWFSLAAIWLAMSLYFLRRPRTDR